MSKWWHAGCLALTIFLTGCRSAPQENSSTLVADRVPETTAPIDAPALAAEVRNGPAEPNPIRLVTSSEPASASGSDPRFANASELSLETLVAEVDARNPSLQIMVAAWQAAAQRYPQAIALDDPMFEAMVAPASFGSSTVEPAYAVQASQKFPWFGKRAARGAAARAGADAAYFDFEDSRVRLDELTRFAFFDYYLARRDLDLNTENIRVLRQFKQIAEVKYGAGQVTQQDVLQADVELGDLDRRRVELERMDRVATARINTLMRRAPGESLPPPPRQLGPIEAPPAATDLERLALERRPDLAAIRSRIDEEQAAVTLACKEYYPDVDIFGRYDTFWQPESTMGDLRGMVGASFNVPIYREKRRAAVDEAIFRLNQRRAEYEQRMLDIQYEVRSAYEQLEESRKTVQIYADRIIPSAQQNVAAARANYDVAKMTFLGLAQTERQLIELLEKQQEVVADYHRRVAELQRAIAGPLPNSGNSSPTILLPPAPR